MHAAYVREPDVYTRVCKALTFEPFEERVEMVTLIRVLSCPDRDLFSVRRVRRCSRTVFVELVRENLDTVN